MPAELDAIVIGSGMGGLTFSAIMAKAGKRVLVLEQHDQAGGCCHTYIDKVIETCFPRICESISLGLF